MRQIKFQIAILFSLLFSSGVISREKMDDSSSTWEVFPIVNYDNDVGIGYGGKGFLYNFFDFNESYDLTFYHSTKGERWYRLALSLPDAQRRHGKKYSIAADLVIDYDKMIFSKYYPNGSLGSYRRENYTKEPVEVTLLLSRGFTGEVIAEAGFRYKSISTYNYDPGGVLQFTGHPAVMEYISVILSLSYDSRNSIINPTEGSLIALKTETAKDTRGQSEEFPVTGDFFLGGFEYQVYIPLPDNRFVFAERILLQKIFGEIQRFQILLPIGGNRTVRGLPQDRYTGSKQVLFNSEFRFPIWWRFGGVAAIDIGNNESTPDFIINPVAGLRFYMDNFVVRFDAGFGEEGVAIYFNFGQMF